MLYQKLGRLEHGKNTPFSIGKHFDEFVDNQVTGGRYSSASDVIRAGLRLLEENEAKMAALRQGLEGEESGPATAFDFDFRYPKARGVVYPRATGSKWSACRIRVGILNGTYPTKK